MNESLIKVSFARFKKNMASYIPVGIMCGLAFVLTATLAFAGGLYFIIAIPLIVLPILFASQVSCYFIETKEQITMSAFSRYYIGFFRSQFRGSYRGIFAFLIAVGIFFLMLFLSYFLMYYVFVGHYGDYFLNEVNTLIENYSSGMTSLELIEAASESRVLMMFFNLTVAAPMPFAILAFIVIVSYNSLSVYYRLNVTSGAPSLLRLGIATAYQTMRKKLIGDWLKLNWWLIALPIVGALIAGSVCVFGYRAFNLLSPSLVVGAVTPLIFFLPFYFPNMEVLYQRYEDYFKEGNKKAIEIILERIQNSIELSEEERRSLEQSFRDDEERKE